jgi:hypothetical protein
MRAEPTRVRTRSALALILAVVAVSAATVHGDGATRKQFVLSPEGNHLWAYDAASGAKQLVVRAQNGSDPGATAPRGSQRRDINGQICVSPDGRHVVTGEDTVVPPRGGGEGSSHDPRIAGWGYFSISGSRLGRLVVRQIGKLAPAAGLGPGYAGDPDNFGCGFIDRNRLLTTAIGDTMPGQPANGQLFLWFGPFERRYRPAKEKSGVGFFVGQVPHCELDRTLATAGGITVDDNGDVYVAANRPDDQGNPGGVWRYRGRFPATPAQCTRAFLGSNVRKELVVPAMNGAPAEVHAFTSSSVVISPDDTLYVSSVFTGTVAEFTKGGRWVRDIYPMSPVTAPTGPTGNTPFGLAITADGSLWIADLGIALVVPGPGLGSVIRLGFDEDRNPAPVGETINDGLDFPDGLGVYTAPA